MRKLFCALSLVLTIASAAPAWADDEAYRLEMPSSAPAGDTINVRGSCAGDGTPKIVSTAFVGGAAVLRGEYRFTGQARTVAQPGTHEVRFTCDATTVSIRTFTVL